MYPVLLDITGKLCAVIGGGKVAERKVKGLLESGAVIRLVSPEVTDTLKGLAGQGMIEWLNKPYVDEDLDGAVLVIAATDSRQAQAKVCQKATQNGQLLNVVDDPSSCSFHVPATVRRGDLTLAVSTNGQSPAVASLIRQQLEEEFGPEYEKLLQVMSLIRKQPAMDENNLSQPERKKIYKKILHSDIIDWIRTGQIEKINDHLKNILGPDTELDVNLPKLDA